MSGHDFYPFGFEMHSGSAPDGADERYTGHERDSLSGADYMKVRYKFSTSLQFLSPDPLLGANDSQSWNRYAYVQNAPTRFVDPLGLTPSELEKPNVITFGRGSDGGRVVSVGCYPLLFGAAINNGVTTYSHIQWVCVFQTVAGTEPDDEINSVGPRGRTRRVRELCGGRPTAPALPAGITYNQLIEEAGGITGVQWAMHVAPYLIRAQTRNLVRTGKWDFAGQQGYSQELESAGNAAFGATAFAQGMSAFDAMRGAGYVQAVKNELLGSTDPTAGTPPLVPPTPNPFAPGLLPPGAVPVSGGNRGTWPYGEELKDIQPIVEGFRFAAWVACAESIR